MASRGIRRGQSFIALFASLSCALWKARNLEVFETFAFVLPSFCLCFAVHPPPFRRASAASSTIIFQPLLSLDSVACSSLYSVSVRILNIFQSQTNEILEDNFESLRPTIYNITDIYIAPLRARVDSHNKILCASHADQRNANFQRVLETGGVLDRDVRSMLLITNLIKLNIDRIHFLIKTRREEQIQAAQNEAMFGASALPPPTSTDSEPERENEKEVDKKLLLQAS
ncbi:hypothetical protein HN51_016266 [Arachis hypogaea]